MAANSKPKVSDYNGYLYVKYRDNKKLVQKYFGSSKSRLAMKEAEAFIESLVRNVNKGVVEKEIDLLKEFDRYVKKKSLSKSTIKIRRVALDKFIAYLCSTFLNDFNKATADKFYTFLKGEHTEQTAELYYKQIKLFFNFLYEAKRIKENYFRYNQ